MQAYWHTLSQEVCCLIGEALLVVILCSSFLLLLWCFLGWMMRPAYASTMLTLLYIQGDAEHLEQQVRAFQWSRDGKKSGGELLLIDCGLTADGLAAAQLLMQERPWLSYCPQPCLEDYLELYQQKLQTE